MRAELARAERAWEVRLAARAWRVARLIDDREEREVAALYPDDRVRVGPVFRVLLTLATLFAVGAGFGVVEMAIDNAGDAWARVFVFVGLMCVLLTEWQTRALRRSDGGTEAGTAWGAALLLALAAPALFTSMPAVVGFFVAALIFAAAAYRWGNRFFGLVAMGSCFGALAQLSWGRIGWILAALVAAPALAAGSRSMRLPPSHRRALREALVVALVALYCSCNLYLFQTGFVERLDFGGDGSVASFGGVAWALSLVGTALLPIALVWIGVRRGPHPTFLRLGVLMAAASLVTLRHYVSLAPMWATMTAGGVALIGGAIALRRWLHRGVDRERYGLTAEPLLEKASERRLAEVALAAAIPHAGPAPEESQPFRGGGGESGGGGATGTF